MEEVLQEICGSVDEGMAILGAAAGVTAALAALDEEGGGGEAGWAA